MYDKDAGFTMVFAVLTACFVIVAAVVLVFGRETKDSDLADISE